MGKIIYPLMYFLSIRQTHYLTGQHQPDPYSKNNQIDRFSLHAVRRRQYDQKFFICILTDYFIAFQ